MNAILAQSVSAFVFGVTLGRDESSKWRVELTTRRLDSGKLASYRWPYCIWESRWLVLVSGYHEVSCLLLGSCLLLE